MSDSNWTHRSKKQSSFADEYTLRMMFTLALSIGLVALAFHLPLDGSLRSIGWQFRYLPMSPEIDVIDVKERLESKQQSKVPITRIEQVQEDPSEEAEEEVPGDVEDLPAPVTPRVERLKTRQAIHDFADQQPEIEGGLGAYYIHINYPQAAIDAGIQGRLLLSFVVERDGHTSQVEVLQSLHPLCDSAAVQALRRTHFIPGKQNGKAVRVRMRLPVTFKLIAPAHADSTIQRPATAESSSP